MTAERRAQLVAELAARADVDEAFAAAALERITRSWTRDAALGVLELQGHELRVVLELVVELEAHPVDVDDVPFDPAPPPVWVPPAGVVVEPRPPAFIAKPTRAPRPVPAEAVAMLRRLGSTYEPAVYQLELGGDVDEATP